MNDDSYGQKPEDQEPENVDFQSSPFIFDREGLRLTPDATISLDEINHTLRFLCLQRRYSPMWIGQLCHLGEQLFGDGLWDVIDPELASHDDIIRLMAVAGKVDRWHPALSWSHHMQAVRLPTAKQWEALQYAADNGLNSTEFRIYISKLLQSS